MSQKEKVIGLGLVCASVGLFYLAINLWTCADGVCQSEVVKAITIDYNTDAGQWSGRNNPNFYVNAPSASVSFPPPTPPQESWMGDGDGGSDGH